MVEEHGQGLLTGVAAMLAAVGCPGFVMWLLNARAARGQARADLVEILRKALDKGRVRENAYLGALDTFISAVDSLEEPPPALVAARARALERLELAHHQLTGGDK